MNYQKKSLMTKTNCSFFIIEKHWYCCWTLNLNFSQFIIQKSMIRQNVWIKFWNSIYDIMWTKHKITELNCYSWHSWHSILKYRTWQKKHYFLRISKKNSIYLNENYHMYQHNQQSKKRKFLKQYITISFECNKNS